MTKVRNVAVTLRRDELAIVFEVGMAKKKGMPRSWCFSRRHQKKEGHPHGQHDGKDAAIVAELVAHGKGTVWPFATLSEHRKMKGLIAMMRKLCKSL